MSSFGRRISLTPSSPAILVAIIQSRRVVVGTTTDILLAALWCGISAFASRITFLILYSFSSVVSSTAPAISERRTSTTALVFPPTAISL
ncbi:hypothetical protein P152DRAFT_260852 [Eremomyces bilateralis CBS 781.70]|uniref:Uncharacterized protein n=1 Tax=Eremomyces bilateralis CBS 781.70 TaxID=1392243 RepID=A0A6G1FQ73_9PEZI|nr:uncharacterized protein P152DRAFT_260852 [Eremomyces bilateralis CBS 781.70]KAF1807954.1 hypothetical protein P152DRAFT_260852 [Eremomyces bilateralis CBS 781.70]